MEDIDQMAGTLECRLAARGWFATAGKRGRRQMTKRACEGRGRDCSTFMSAAEGYNDGAHAAYGLRVGREISAESPTASRGRCAGNAGPPKFI